ncbi:MAG: PfkB family carbohydrate kinase, partial [Aurantimicrobium sp.]
SDAMVFNEIGTPCSNNLGALFCSQILDVASNANVVTINGSLPPGFPLNSLSSVVSSLEANGCHVIVDSSPEALWESARAGAFLLKPNASELRATTGNSDLLSAARELINAGAQHVLVSLGEEGMMLISRDSEHTLLAKLDAPVHGNPTGAGDALVAALAAGIDQDFPSTSDDWAHLLTTAVSWSAAAVLEPLAGYLHPDHVTLRTRVQITEMRNS